MTNDELAKHLNAQVGLTGGDAVTANVIRQWVDWDVLPKSTPTGRSVGQSPNWTRNGNGIARAVRLAQLRIAGIRRKDAVIAQAYLEWGHPDFDRVKISISREFRKWREQLHRRQTTFMGNNEFRELSAVKKRAIANQLGALDNLFIGTSYQQSPELYALLGNISRTSEGDQQRAESLIADAFRQIAESAAELIPETAISTIALSLRGFTGLPDEIGNSGEEAIGNATDQQFQLAREIVQRLIKSFDLTKHENAVFELPTDTRNLLTTLNLLAPQISVGPWRLALFVQMLNLIVRGPKLGIQIPRN